MCNLFKVENIMRKKNLKFLCLSLLAVTGLAEGHAQQSATLELMSSKDIQLRVNNASQNPLNATFELRESTGGNGEMDYGFCGLLGFDLQPVREKMVEGYKISGVRVQLTNANNVSSSFSLRPFGYDWEEARTTTWDALASQIAEAVGQEAVAQGSLPNIGGKKPFELRDVQAVEHYDIGGYQATLEGDALTDYVAEAADGGEAGVAFLLVGDNDVTNSIQIYTKDATRDGSGTSTTDKWQWNGAAWEQAAGQSVTRYEQCLAYFGLTEEEFQKAVTPRLFVDLTESGVKIPAALPVEADVTSANTVRTSNAGTTTVTDNQGVRTENVFYSNQNNGILYLGRYDLSQLRSIKAVVAFAQSNNNYVSANLAVMDAADGEVTVDYLDANYTTIRHGNNGFLYLRGGQTINGETPWNNGFKRGVEYTVDVASHTIAADTEEYEAYWAAEGEVVAVDYSTNTKDNTTKQSELGNRFEAAVSSDRLQDLFLYATAQSGRVCVSSLTLYFADNSEVTLPVQTMNGYAVDRQLSAATIKASAELDGTPISELTLGSVEMSGAVADALAELQEAGITSVEAESVDYALTVSAAGAATLVLPYDAVLPEGVKAYTLSYTSGDAAVAEEVNSLTANRPVLVNAAEGTYHVTAADAGLVLAESPVSGALCGNYASGVTVPEGSYVLQNQTAGLAFYQVTEGMEFEAAPFRAYLTPQAAGVNRLLIDWGDGTTGIGSAMTEEADIADGPVYNLQGVKVADGMKGLNGLPKGIYIVNGKKYVVK